ncbi:hypothetical protein YB2330_001316 [Saitoella coloradoensis]
MTETARSRDTDPLLSRDSAELHRVHHPHDELRHSLDTTSDEEQHLQPTSPTDPYPHTPKIDYWNGLALIIGLQIGSGIFSSPGTITSHVNSLGASLVVWLISGLLAWTGAATYAELGTSLPESGGPKAYFARVYGPLPSFLFLFTVIGCLKPGTIAIIAVVFASYATRMLGVESHEGSVLERCIAVGIIWCVIGINMLGAKEGMRVGRYLAVLKVGAVCSVAVLGASTLLGGHAVPDFKRPLFEGSSTDLGDYALAFYSSLWAYEGWDNVNYITADLHNPTRLLPLILHSAQPLVITLYLLATLSYSTALSFPLLTSSHAIAVDFADAVVGRWGGVVFGGIVAASCVGALNATVFTASRLCTVAGGDGSIPRIFGWVHPERGTPIPGLLLQGSIGMLLVLLIPTFSRLTAFYGICGLAWYFTVGVAACVLRFTEPGLVRPYKASWATLLGFVGVGGFMLVRGVIAEPGMTVAVGGFFVLGVVVFFLKGQPKMVTAP